MPKEKNKGGRPPYSEYQKQCVLQKLEPYLKKGLSTRKALGEAKIPRASFYRIMARDEKFRDQIARFRQYLSVLLCKVLLYELERIVEKQAGNEEENIPPQPLDETEIKFLFSYALKSPLTAEEWGRRTTTPPYHPEEDIQKLRRMIDEHKANEINTPR